MPRRFAIFLSAFFLAPFFAHAQITPPQAVNDARTMPRPDPKAMTSGGSASANVPSYGSDASSMSNLFSGGHGNLTTPGMDRVTACSTLTDKECQAVQLIQNGKATRPTFTINPADPLIAGSTAIRANPAPVHGPNPFGGMTSPTTQCTTSTTTTPGTFNDETCDIATPTEEQTCAVVRDILVDRDANYRCDTIGNQVSQYVCDKNLSVTVTLIGTTCTPGTWVTPFPGPANIFLSGGRNVHIELSYLCEIGRTDGKLKVRVGAGTDGAYVDSTFVADVEIGSPVPIPGQYITTLPADQGYQISVFHTTSGNLMTADRWNASFYYTTFPPPFVPIYSCPSGGFRGNDVLLWDSINGGYNLPGDPGTCYVAFPNAGVNAYIPSLDQFVLDGSTYPGTFGSYVLRPSDIGVLSLDIERPRNLYSITDSWINGCAALEARQ